MTSLSDVEYSRILPQPVHVRLHVCNGSSCRTVANLLVPRSLCHKMWPAIFIVSAKGKRISKNHNKRRKLSAVRSSSSTRLKVNGIRDARWALLDSLDIVIVVKWLLWAGSNLVKAVIHQTTVPVASFVTTFKDRNAIFSPRVLEQSCWQLLRGAFENQIAAAVFSMKQVLYHDRALVSHAEAF
jgi:hypothetical protein